MDVSCQPHALATLLPGTQPPVLIEQEVRWDPDPIWTFWRRENLLHLLGFKPWIIQPAA